MFDGLKLTPTWAAYQDWTTAVQYALDQSRVYPGRRHWIRKVGRGRGGARWLVTVTTATRRRPGEVP